jgi:hypothetical protein
MARAHAGRGVSVTLAAAEITGGWSCHRAGSAERLRCRRQASPLFNTRAFKTNFLGLLAIVVLSADSPG